MKGLSEIKQDPDAYKGHLIIFGGIIVKTEPTKDGSVIEAIFVPVISLGYLKSYKTTSGRFLAIYKSREILDPLIFSERRDISLAGEFIEVCKGKIGEMEYDYPLFEIKEIHLWEEMNNKDYYYYHMPHLIYTGITGNILMIRGDGITDHTAEEYTVNK